MMTLQMYISATHCAIPPL